MYTLLAALLILFPGAFSYVRPLFPSDEVLLLHVRQVAIDGEYSQFTHYWEYTYPPIDLAIASTSESFWSTLDAPRPSSFAANLPPAAICRENWLRANKYHMVIKDRFYNTDFSRPDIYLPLIEDAAKRERVWFLVDDFRLDNPSGDQYTLRCKARELADLIGHDHLFRGLIPAPVSPIVFNSVYPE